MKKSKLIGWPIVLIISLALIVVGLWLGFTKQGLDLIGYDSTAGYPYYVAQSFGGSENILSLLSTLVFESFVGLFVFDASINIISIACYCIIGLSIILVIIQLITYIHSKKPSMILWIIVTLLFAFGGSLVCALSKEYFGVNGELFADSLNAPEGSGTNGSITIKTTLLFQNKGLHGILLSIFAYVVLLGILLFVISSLVILIQTLVYASSHKLDKYFKQHPELAKANTHPSIGFDNGEAAIGGSTNNINTVGNSSPLVIQYINSYGTNDAPIASKPQCCEGHKETPTEPKGECCHKKEEHVPPMYGYPYPPMYGYPYPPYPYPYPPMMPQQPQKEEKAEGNNEKPLTKSDLKEVINETIAELKKADEEKEVVEERVYQNEDGEELEYVDLDELKEMIKTQIKEAVDEFTPIQVEPQKDEPKEDPTINPAETTGYAEEPRLEEKVAETPTFIETKEPETKVEVTTPIVVAVPSKAIEEDLPEEPEVSEETVEETLTEEEVRSLISEELKEALKDFSKPKKKRIIHKITDHEVPEYETQIIKDDEVTTSEVTKVKEEKVEEVTPTTSETTKTEEEKVETAPVEVISEEKPQEVETTSLEEEEKPIETEVSETKVEETPTQEVIEDKVDNEPKPTEVSLPKEEQPQEVKVEEPKTIEPVIEEVKEEKTEVEEKKAPVKQEPRGKEAEIEKGEVIRLNFFERIVSGDEILKNNYQSIKALLMSYGLKDRISSTGDTFRLHKVTYAKITALGDSLKIYLALDPKDYYSTALPVQDVSKKDAYKDIPLAFKIRSDLSLRRANELILAAMRKAGFEPIPDFTPEDYVKEIEGIIAKNKEKESK